MALNYQTNDFGMFLNMSKFQVGMNRGYVLKPNKIYGTKIIIKIISGSQFRIINPYIEVHIRGADDL